MTLLRFLPRFRKAYRELGRLEARERWSRGEIEAWQLERLNALWPQAVARVPYYQRLAEKVRLPRRFASLQEFRGLVPVLARERVRAAPRDFLAAGAGRGRWLSTSGSTGATTRVFWPHAAHREVLRGKYRFLASWGVDVFDPTVFLWGHGAGMTPGLGGWVARRWQPLADRLRNRLRLPAYRLGSDDLRAHLHAMARFRPALLYAYSAAGYLLARAAEAEGFRCDSLRLAVLTAEPVFPVFVRTIERVLRVPAVAEYGSVECGFLAGEGPDRTLRVREDTVLLETLPREDGRYDLVATVLTNPGYPLLRYALGDVTELPLEVPSRGFARLHGVAGRDNDLVLTRTGQPIHANWFDHVFEPLPTVRRWRVHQHADGRVAVGVEMNDPAAALPAGVARDIAARVEGYPVQVDVVHELPLTAAGKHRWVVSDLAHTAWRTPPAGVAICPSSRLKHERNS